MRPADAGITLDDAAFRKILKIAASEAGLAIPEAKRSLVQSRVARRMRDLGIEDCGVYLYALNSNDTETQKLISALTTNVSHFFREKHHFDTIRDTFLTQPESGRLRFWSAGCSKGQEPYSLAIEILKAIPDANQRDILILATDIDQDILEKASAGSYMASEADNIADQDRSRFFADGGDGTLRVTDQVKSLVRFRHLNLNARPWPMKGPFDAILCRNVVIYFDDATQAKLWPRFHELLRCGGLLMLGHSERIQPTDNSGLVAAGVTTYRKT